MPSRWVLAAAFVVAPASAETPYPQKHPPRAERAGPVSAGAKLDVVKAPAAAATVGARSGGGASGRAQPLHAKDGRSDYGYSGERPRAAPVGSGE
ncbi:hypothetical protein G5B40_08105 [Pikeienuella piscinae]|uniref:Uncharacterized protein n=1 Tax=Pikeienuella piscinae TaxID=2748098 RepID=A0A7L5BVK4_9RHOB|nr:hypothetical protein [Pikeienuella piscinae]QIE55421.1 hypothetical protein G5B40_08105 [Pikeienuella piscinae]